MDTTFRRKHSNEGTNKGSEGFFKNFKKNIKNFFATKFSSSSKYELCDNHKQEQEISIISYEDNKCQEIEPKKQINNTKTVPTYSLSIDEKLIKSLEKIVKERKKLKPVPAVVNTRPLPSNFKGKLELLQIIERTFNRQIDIFEQLLKVTQNDLNQSATVEMNNKKQKALQKKAMHDNAMDMFVNDLLKHIVLQLTNCDENVPTNAITSGSNNDASSSTGRKIHFGDNSQIKQKEISCECQHPNETGGAVPLPYPNNSR